jgi:dipeptidyl aminopeptidase/acylaminoacyl peptidase
MGDAEKAAFSPDGKSVIYATADGDVMVVGRDGSQPHKLARAGPGADAVRLSPDGRVIRFAKDGGLWEMGADGSGIHRLIPDWHEPGYQCCGGWTRDGKFYLFLLFNTSSRGSQIWAIDERRGWLRRPTSRPIPLTTGPIFWYSPISSPEGKKIFASGWTPHGELSRIDPKSGGFQPFLGGISAEYVSFSGDGKSIAYVSYPEGILWIADRDGNNRVQLTEPPNLVAHPRWSPDSKQIAFMAKKAEGQFACYVVSTDGGKPRRLLPEDSGEQIDPHWSPDGTKILFAWGAKQDLRILDLLSREVHTVEGSTGMWSPRWSKDGRYIAALDRDSQTVMHVFDVKQQRWTRLDLDGDGSYPNFSHDGRLIYFLQSGAAQGVFRIPVTGGKTERVVDLKDWHLTGQFFASMSLDPTDAPLMLRDSGSGDIYALTLEE